MCCLEIPKFAELPANVSKKPMDLVESYTGSGKVELPAGQLKRVDHGISPSKVDPKRRRSGCLQLKDRSIDLQSTPIHEDQCCNCTKTSMCQTKRCKCFTARQPCLCCDCKEKCRNQQANKKPTMCNHHFGSWD
jgi:hypothetical protein